MYLPNSKVAVLVTTSEVISLVKDIFQPFSLFKRYIGGNEISHENFLKLMQDDAGWWGKMKGLKMNGNLNIFNVR